MVSRDVSYKGQLMRSIGLSHFSHWCVCTGRGHINIHPFEDKIERNVGILTGNAFGFMRAVKVVDVFVVAHCPRGVGDAKALW